jgi:hypothetical protein
LRITGFSWELSEPRPSPGHCDVTQLYSFFQDGM